VRVFLNVIDKHWSLILTQRSIAVAKYFDGVDLNLEALEPALESPLLEKQAMVVLLPGGVLVAKEPELLGLCL
jgi:hypothetical protein